MGGFSGAEGGKMGKGRTSTWSDMGVVMGAVMEVVMVVGGKEGV